MHDFSTWSIPVPQPEARQCLPIMAGAAAMTDVNGSNLPVATNGLGVQICVMCAGLTKAGWGIEQWGSFFSGANARTMLGKREDLSSPNCDPQPPSRDR